jgi:hypothetical protein
MGWIALNRNCYILRRNIISCNSNFVSGDSDMQTAFFAAQSHSAREGDRLVT